MITPVDEVIYDHRVGCTEDEAVAKLLGWMQGSKRLRHIQVTVDGIDIEQLQHLYQLPTTLAEFVRDERDFARGQLEAAIVAGDFNKVLKWEKIVERWDGLNERSMRYRLAITEELSKRTSRLMLDEKLTNETGVRHISLISLDRWARLAFGIAIINTAEDQQETNLGLYTKSNRTVGESRASAILEDIRWLGLDPKQLPARERGKAGAKAEVWKRLESRKELFPKRKLFDKAWELLRSRGEIVDSPQN